MADTDQNSQLAALLAQVQALGAGGNVTASPWTKPAQSTGSPEVLGVSIPVSLETPAGKLRVYLNFSGAFASSPAALQGLVEQLANAGLPLDTYQPKQQSSGGWGGNSGGYNRGGGGYNSNRGGWGGR